MTSEFHDEDIVRLRVALGRISRQLDRKVANDDLTRSQMSVLSTVARRGPLGVSALAHLEGLNPTMLSRVLAKLDEAGLITREAALDDRRAVEVVVTAAGTRKHDRWREERAKVLAEFVARIPPDDARQLLAALPALEHLGEAMFADLIRS